MTAISCYQFGKKKKQKKDFVYGWSEEMCVCKMVSSNWMQWNYGNFFLRCIKEKSSALFKSLKDLYEKHNDTADGRIRVWFGVRQIINVTNHLLLGKTDAGQKLNTGIHMTRCNSICWNPREPMNFTAGNEDTHCYSFHAGKLDEAKVVHKGHVSAVMDIDYSPTGREFVTGSYDRTFGMDLAI
ncbi:uncharacterized protein LOC102706581 isoform X2 [Oryza brachyantha]|uniref:uncharacterized protein LOC102706581 isoform X2 n=1 Tax=Oryza brachyantha TaxID=4533 RepID=UPI0007762596|nr:uncharacterized protein LOC102706581 isoform X2 [Oryza brachyantha]